MHLKNSGQLSGTYMNTFWENGANLSNTYETSLFTKLSKTEFGWIGWNKVRLLNQSQTISVLVTGTNSNNHLINEKYTLTNFNPNMSNNNIEIGNLSSNGYYSIARLNDVDTRSNWGTCGSGTNSNTHVGFGLCPYGFDGSAPLKRVVQVWFYGNLGSGYYMNVSFGNDLDTRTTENYQGNKTFDFYMYFR